MFGHQKCFGRFQASNGVPWEYRKPPRSIMGLLGHGGEEEGRPGQVAPPSPSSPNWTRRGAPFLPLSLLLPPSPTPTRKEGVLLPVGVGLPPWRALLLAIRLLPSSFIYGGRGHPKIQQLI